MATVIKQLGRTVHTSNSGIEIVRTFDVMPYDGHVEVLRALQGYVDGNGDRQLPAADPYIKNCYCTEAVVDTVHPDAMVSAHDINVPDDLDASLRIKTQPLSGCKIVARYRPLITAYKSKDADKPDPKIFDYIDPTFSPGTRQLPWPNGTFVEISVGQDTLSWSLDAYPQPFAVPVTDFTIRRLLVKDVPRDAINERLNCVNSHKWPPDKDPLSEGLPQFEAETLKFVAADVQNMVDADGNRLYEITYHFQWITLEDELADKNGKVKEGTVTWNHAFLGPVGQPLAWYRVYRAEKVLKVGLLGVTFMVQLPGALVARGPLHKVVFFDDLFE